MNVLRIWHSVVLLGALTPLAAIGCAADSEDDTSSQGSPILKYAAPGEGLTTPPPETGVVHVGTFQVKNGDGTCLTVSKSALKERPGVAGPRPTTKACAPADSGDDIQRFALYKVVEVGANVGWPDETLHHICVPGTGTLTLEERAVNTGDQVFLDDVFQATCLTPDFTAEAPIPPQRLSFRADVLAVRPSPSSPPPPPIHPSLPVQPHDGKYRHQGFFTLNSPYIEQRVKQSEIVNGLPVLLEPKVFRLDNRAGGIELIAKGATDPDSQKWTFAE